MKMALTILAFGMLGWSNLLHGQETRVVVVVGAAGEPQYGKLFQTWAQRWQEAATAAQHSVSIIGAPQIIGENDEVVTVRDQLRDALLSSPRSEAGQTTDSAEDTSTVASNVWLILIGHGTFDGNVAKFNLEGPDISATELAQWLEEARTTANTNLPQQQPTYQVVINCASSSSPFINRLSAPGRVVVTATQHEAQFNFARFGDYLSQQLAAGSLDLDKDQQTSLLELVLGAAGETREFYQDNKRLATEMALIDDNGDQAGTPTEWFTGVRVQRQAKDRQPDGLLANQIFFSRPPAKGGLSPEKRALRDQLERQLESLRGRKESMPEWAYLEELEALLVRIARLY